MGIFASCRIRRERHLVSFAHGNIRALGVMPPEDTSIRSTPISFSSLQTTTESSISQPFSTQSVAEMRTKSGNPALLAEYLTLPRAASAMDLAWEPPY